MSGVFGRHRTGSAEETAGLGRLLAGELSAGDVVSLHGELGAGKTQFVRGLASGLGHAPGLVSSPTFVVMNEYDGAGARCPLVHVDAYRLTGADDVDSLGWERVTDGSCVVAVEWGERIEPRLGARRVDVTIAHAGGEAREVVIARIGGGSARCRTCGAALDVRAGDGVFCTERCRMADLGKWFGGAYRIGRDLKDSDVEPG